MKKIEILKKKEDKKKKDERDRERRDMVGGE